MNKYKLMHRANAKQVWEVREIEANWVQTTPAGDLSFGLENLATGGIIAAGWWMSVERIDPQPPTV